MTDPIMPSSPRWDPIELDYETAAEALARWIELKRRARAELARQPRTDVGIRLAALYNADGTVHPSADLIDTLRDEAWPAAPDVYDPDPT